MVRSPALDKARGHKRPVILGDPGSGKSTFVRMIARSAALDWINNAADPDLGRQCIPVIITLRKLVESLQALDPENPDETLIQTQFKTYISKSLTDVAFELPEFAKAFLKTLKTQPTLLIFDGMDEVPQHLRGAARAWLETIINHYKPQKAIITCRIRSYFDEAVISNVPSYTLASFDKEQIESFTLAWYRANDEKTPDHQKALAKDFFDYVTDDRRIFEMAANPLLLTQMAVLHQKDLRLPDQRVALYEEIVGLLLTRWQEKNKVPFKISKKLADLLEQKKLLRRAVEHLAFISHRNAEGNQNKVDLPILTVLETFNEHFIDYGLAEEFLRYLDQRSGLLQGKGGTIKQADTYSFPHRTFQEYLAGCHINRQSQHAKLRLLAEIAGEGDYWDVVFQLAIEERFHIGEDPDLVTLAADICTFCDDSSENGHRMVYWSALLEKLLGEKAIQDYDDPAHHITIGSEYLSTLRGKLLTVATGIKLTPVERAEAADVLDSLGYVPDDLFTFVKIPGDEKIPTFWMGKYPVTNAQYARFLTPENFADKSLWTDFPQFASPEEGYQEMESTGDAGWDWLQKALQDKSNLVEEGVLYPRFWRDSHFGEQRATAPVVGVTWWEANAYTRWLLIHWDDVEEGQQGFLQGMEKPALLHLPCEDQWILGAGGEKDNRYAFGTLKNPEKEITQYCNTHEGLIERTTQVWTFPKGASSHTVMHLSGNIWEWQGNYLDKFHDSRALRGGSWHSHHKCAKTKSRSDKYYLSSWNYDIGFRLIVLTPQL